MTAFICDASKGIQVQAELKSVMFTKPDYYAPRIQK